MTRVVGSVARAVVTAGLFGALAAPLPIANASPNLFAQATPAPAVPAQTAPAQTAPAQPAQAQPAPPAHASHGMMHQTARTRGQYVDFMITNLHRKLYITAAQQSQFDVVAGVMRSNAKAMEALLAERAHDTDRSAPASVAWYEKLTDAHAAALKSFAPVFATLYASLSENQRRAADAMFLQLGKRPMMPKGR